MLVNKQFQEAAAFLVLQDAFKLGCDYNLLKAYNQTIISKDLSNLAVLTDSQRRGEEIITQGYDTCERMFRLLETWKGFTPETFGQTGLKNQKTEKEQLLTEQNFQDNCNCSVHNDEERQIFSQDQTQHQKLQQQPLLNESVAPVIHDEYYNKNASTNQQAGLFETPIDQQKDTLFTNEALVTSDRNFKDGFQSTEKISNYYPGGSPMMQDFYNAGEPMVQNTHAVGMSKPYVQYQIGVPSVQNYIGNIDQQQNFEPQYQFYGDSQQMNFEPQTENFQYGQQPFSCETATQNQIANPVGIITPPDNLYSGQTYNQVSVGQDNQQPSVQDSQVQQVTTYNDAQSWENNNQAQIEPPQQTLQTDLVDINQPISDTNQVFDIQPALNQQLMTRQPVRQTLPVQSKVQPLNQWDTEQVQPEMEKQQPKQIFYPYIAQDQANYPVTTHTQSSQQLNHGLELDHLEVPEQFKETEEILTTPQKQELFPYPHLQLIMFSPTIFVMTPSQLHCHLC